MQIMQKVYKWFKCTITELPYHYHEINSKWNYLMAHRQIHGRILNYPSRNHMDKKTGQCLCCQRSMERKTMWVMGDTQGIKKGERWFRDEPQQSDLFSCNQKPDRAFQKINESSYQGIRLNTVLESHTLVYTWRVLLKYIDNVLMQQEQCCHLCAALAMSISICLEFATLC